MRGKPSDHLLFAGPPGLGKTTLANIVAGEMGVAMHSTSGPALERAGDLAVQCFVCAFNFKIISKVFCF